MRSQIKMLYGLPYKSIYFKGENGEDIFIDVSTETINDLLETPNEDAELFDEQISYYVPNDVFSLSDEKILKYIDENIDKIF